MNNFLLILLACLCGPHLALGADTPSGVAPKIAKEPRVAKLNVSTATPPTCSTEWIQLLDEQCDGSGRRDCIAMLNEARRLLIAQRKVMDSVLTDAGVAESEKLWNRYQDAECKALVPQCPYGVSGSCNLPSAICKVQMDCEHVVHLRTIECQTNGYNRSLQAPPKPDGCK